MKAVTAILSGGKTLLVLSVFLLVAFGGLFYVDGEVKKNSQRLATLILNAERIQNLDTKSASSVRLAAGLQSDRYIMNYQDLQDAKYALLEENLQYIQNDRVRASLDKMEEVQGDIEDAESEAIALIDEEAWAEALELVTEPAFRRQKGIYRSRLSAALREMINEGQLQTDHANMLARATQYGVLGTFLLLTLIGLVYSREMKRSLLRQSELASHLEDANENLEQRVNDRTKELHENQQTLRDVLENIAQGVAAIDRAGKLITWNRTYQSIFEFSDEILFPGQSLRTMVANVAKRGGVWRGRGRGIGGKPHRRAVKWRGYPVGNDAERWQGVRYAANDHRRGRRRHRLHRHHRTQACGGGNGEKPPPAG